MPRQSKPYSNYCRTGESTNGRMNSLASTWRGGLVCRPAKLIHSWRLYTMGRLWMRRNAALVYPKVSIIGPFWLKSGGQSGLLWGAWQVSSQHQNDGPRYSKMRIKLLRALGAIALLSCLSFAQSSTGKDASQPEVQTESSKSQSWTGKLVDVEKTTCNPVLFGYTTSCPVSV